LLNFLPDREKERIRNSVRIPYIGIWRRLKGLKGVTSDTRGESAKRKIPAI
jgi:hypothetical protein